MEANQRISLWLIICLALTGANKANAQCQPLKFFTTDYGSGFEDITPTNGESPFNLTIEGWELQFNPFEFMPSCSTWWFVNEHNGLLQGKNFHQIDAKGIGFWCSGTQTAVQVFKDQQLTKQNEIFTKNMELSCEPGTGKFRLTTPQIDQIFNELKIRAVICNKMASHYDECLY